MPPKKTKDMPMNWDLLNKIRSSASLEYQMRIPRATRSNIADIEAKLWNPYNSRLKNEFIDALVQRIGELVIQSRRWTDPFKEFKKKDMKYGSTIEEVGIGLLRAHAYDFNDTSALLRVNEPYVRTAFHSVSRRDRYDLTIDEPLLRTSFLEDTGLADFISGLLDAQMNSDEEDEYLLVHGALAEFDRRHGIFKVHIDDFRDPSVDVERAARNAVKKIRSLAGHLQFLKSDYTALDCPKAIRTFAKRENIVAFVTPDFLAEIDVEALAQTLYISKEQIPFRIRLVDSFMIPGVECVLMDTDALIMKDVIYQTDSFYNGSTITTNYFLHHHQIISFSPFLPMIALTTGEGTQLPSVTVTPDTFNLGYIDPDDLSIKTTFPAKMGVGSQFQLIGWRKLTIAGKDVAGNDVEFQTIDGSMVDVACQSGNTTAKATMNVDFEVNRLGVLTIPENTLDKLAGDGLSGGINLHVNAVSAYLDETLPPAARTVVQLTGGQITPDGRVYEVNEKVRRAFYEYMGGARDLPAAVAP